ncbi:hypothetical protein [Bosea psychrotolerans]|uniref:Uncharacterized protein n=1 Tax=Bosea psychrotolerans TaxID=1871628 RepID=A0A2S4MCV6_9HYPH|nr:hypothetical protein [Bosea psychrotolerans]POR52465.1 hypothetical protein CYD53_105130 [Bosea psychrotolerans]
MPKFPWKTTLAATTILGSTAFVFAQTSPGMNGPTGMHRQMMSGQMAQGAGDMSQMHKHMMQGRGGMGPAMGQGTGEGTPNSMHGASGEPTMPGQDAFGAIQEVVQILAANPATDWSKVNITGLRDHLIDMNEVTLRAAASERILGDSIEIMVTGEGRTLAAIKRMVPAHVKELKESGWKAETDELPDGVKLTVNASETMPLAKLKALGFIGIMVQGAHHQAHHLMMAKGGFAEH